MTNDELKKVLDDTVGRLNKLLTVKGGEYQGAGGDRLGNFKRGGLRVGVEPLTILHIYLSKHLDAIDTFVRRNQLGERQVLSEPIRGRIDDAINYLILMQALITETTQKECSLTPPIPTPSYVSGGRFTE